VTTRTRVPGKYETIRGTAGTARYGGWNPLLYEFARIVRAIRKRWSADPANESHWLSRLFYALCGTATFFGYHIVIAGLHASPIFVGHLSSPTGGAFSDSVAYYLLPVAALLFTFFFAILLMLVDKPRGRIMLYLEGVALPAATMALIQFSLGGRDSTS